MLYLGQTDKMSEKEVNAKLIAWIQDVARMQAFDHVTLRRALVDAGYLTRSSDGATYQISPFNPRAWQFEAAIEHLDVLDVLNTAREEMAQRKRAYLEKAQKQKRG
jgi:DNA-binding IclR family transcriptional regulator